MMDETKDASDAAAKPEGLSQADSDRAKIMAAMQGIREQEAKDLKDDLAKFENRPKPLWYQDGRPAADAGRVGDQWEDKGIIDVPVADLPQPEDVNGPQDFDHHISYDDAVLATKQLQEMKSLIDAGYKSQDFAALDEQNGVDYEAGQQRVYDLFYGSDPITLDKNSDQYDIVSGRHRVFIAKEGGYNFVPARVREKVSH